MSTNKICYCSCYYSMFQYEDTFDDYLEMFLQYGYAIIQCFSMKTRLMTV